MAEAPAWHRGRKVLREGPVSIKRFFGMSSREVHLLLFEGGVLALMDSRAAEPFDGFPLSTATFKAAGGAVFSVASGKKSFTFHCESEAERDEWLGALLEAKLDARNAPQGGEEAEACVVQ